MIKEEQLIEVGYVQKTHGLKGELNCAISDAVFDEVDECPYLVCDMDGIFVPFFISEYRWRGDNAILLLLDDIDSKEKAEGFCGKKLYFDRKCFTDDEASDYDERTEEEAGLVGYHVVDQTYGDLGEITAIDDQTANILFIIDHNGDDLLIPAADELIVDIDDENQTITMDLPTGLVNPDEAESEDEPFFKI